MDAKKTVLEYIRPKLWLLIIGAIGFAAGIVLISLDNETLSGVAFVVMLFTTIPFVAGLFGTIPARIKSNIAVKALEKSGKLEDAAKELTGEDVTVLCKKTVSCTEHFIFVKKGSYVRSYDELLWIYKNRLVRRVLLIPISTTDSLIICDKKGSYEISMGGKDKNNELSELITKIYRHNSRVLVGYTKENETAYNQLKKA